jgi:hypothetical protein
MARPVCDQLAPVRRRQRWVTAAQSSIWGLIGSSFVAIGLELARSLEWLAISTAAVWAVLAAGPVLAALVGLVSRHTWQAAAIAVDNHYRLKDRVLTALAFLRKPGNAAWSELQVADALKHLAQVEPQRVVPMRMPRALPYAAMGLVVAVALNVWLGSGRDVSAGPSEPLAVVLAQADELTEDLKEMEELARQEQNKELEDLVEELREKVEALKQPGVDEREALAKLSEMEAAIKAQQAQYNVAAVDAQLQSLGNAMQVAESMQSAGKALAESKFDKAAEELEKLDEPKLERKEAKALEEQLRKAAQAMDEAGLASLSECTSQMCESCKGDGKKFKAATSTLAKEARAQARRKKINDLLCAECNKLSECKCNCQKNSFAKGKKPQKSTSPSSTFGMGTSGNTAGEKTELAVQNQFEQLTGQEGDGDSEVETEHSVEGRQEAGRSYRDVYQKYRKLSESVLDSEPIPLGHRQTIRRYFESIRPQQTDEAAPPEKTAKP